MIKTVFNNPWFIGLLGAAATIYLGSALIQPLYDDDPSASTVMPAPLGLSIFSSEKNSSASADQIQRFAAVGSREKIGWLDDIKRDPFAGTAMATGSGSEIAMLPKVVALFVSDGVKAAVVNNRLVRVGDQIEQFRVTHIGEAHVQVSKSGRSYRLEPEV
ncbi:MAG: hypothetical protein GXP16_09555 [Gammaproteobacteria bacterium]|nr:hypothetical protein [Gammaproteobacteria bacterium]